MRTIEEIEAEEEEMKNQMAMQDDEPSEEEEAPPAKVVSVADLKMDKLQIGKIKKSKKTDKKVDQPMKIEKTKAIKKTANKI